MALWNGVVAEHHPSRLAARCDLHLRTTLYPASLRGAARDRHGLRGGMRWTPRRSMRLGAWWLAEGPAGACQGRLTTTPRRTAQSAISRRIALRHGAAPRLAPRTEGGPRRGSPLELWFNPRVEHRGSSRSKPLKPSRAERRMCPVLSWRRHSCAFTFLHTGLRTHHASGVPRPLSTGRMELRKPRTWKHAVRMRSRVW